MVLKKILIAIIITVSFLSHTICMQKRKHTGDKGSPPAIISPKKLDEERNKQSCCYDCCNLTLHLTWNCIPCIALGFIAVSDYTYHNKDGVHTMITQYFNTTESQ